MIGQFGRPKKIMFAWYGMNSTNGQFEADLAHSLPRHGDPPVIGAVVDQEQLKTKKQTTITLRAALYFLTNR